MDTDIVSSITSHGPGYLDKDLEKVVGLQTDKPLKRAFMPYGGIRMGRGVLRDVRIYSKPRAAQDLHCISQDPQQGVFDAYTPEIRAARKNKDHHWSGRIPTAVAVS